VSSPRIDRRAILRVFGAIALGAALPKIALAAAGPEPTHKPLNGLFPIAETPFTEADKIDLECLTNQIRFCNKAGVPGLAWPQIASGWSSLTVDERFMGTEALCSANKGGTSSVVIGVQTKGNDLPGAIAFAKHAAAHGADAIISLPPDGENTAVMEYYKAIGAATGLPLFVQTIGDKMTTDFVAAMYKEIPTMKVVKDEAGDPLQRVTEIRAKTGDKLAVFAGKGVTLMVDEMRLGFTGFCPVVGLSDVFQQAWELHRQGKIRESFDMFGRVMAFNTVQHASQYLMVARGIFKENTKSRPTPGMGPAVKPAPPTEAEKQVVRDSLNLYLKPYLRA
jgi:dihydrodipicolinate synthase/N-acetylneuraminate lyase